ncbi:hypothetical protein MKEN_01070200 [Mycena kentingensis (nom. inval.)]|nr:hypothetical protein MKEN_01070200 [Mycena kentingensis (nom. inval.)]
MADRPVTAKDLQNHNNKRFDVLKEKLATVKGFIPAAAKFRQWLGDSKAYYLDARPQILQIIQIASNTLRQDNDALAPDIRKRLVDSFLGMVHTVRRFENYFEFAEEQAALKEIYVNTSILETVLLPQPPQPVSSSSTPVDQPVSSSSTPVDLATGSLLLAEPAADTRQSASTKTMTPVAPDPQVTTTNVQPAPVRKKKRKRAADFGKMMEQDAETFAVLHKPPRDLASPVVTHASTPVTVPKTEPRSPPKLVMPKLEPEIIDLVSPDEETAPTLPQPTADEDVQMLDVEKPQLSPTTEAEVDRVVRKLTIPDDVANDVISELKTQDPVPENSQPVAQPADPQEPPEPSQSTTEPEPVVGVETISEETASRSLSATPTPVAAHIEMEQVDVDATIEPEISAPADKLLDPESTPQPLFEKEDPATMHQFLCDFVAKINERISPETQGSEQTQVPLADSLEPSTSVGCEVVPQSIFGRHRGQATGPITMNFSVGQEQLDGMKYWNGRWKQTEISDKALCASLLCFREADIKATDIKARPQSTQQTSLESIIPNLPCSWPTNGDLILTTSWNGQTTELPISFALRANEPPMADMSPYVSLGANTFSFTQTSDLTGYCLVLCVHHPTPAQLLVVERQRAKQRKWSGWLQNLGQAVFLPFEMPVAEQVVVQ